MRNNDIKLPILRSQIETAIGHSVVTPKDFDSLRDMIFSRLHIYVSSTTLKRIWGYLNDDVTPRQSTLNILARYLGYVDFEAFANGDVATAPSARAITFPASPGAGTPSMPPASRWATASASLGNQRACAMCNTSAATLSR